MHHLLILTLIFLSSNFLYGNVIFPSWIMYSYLHKTVSLYLLVIGMVFVEFVGLSFFFPHYKKMKIFWVAVLMNAASAVLGLLLHLGGDAGFELLLWKKIQFFFENSPQAYAIAYCLWFIGFGALINTIIEFPIAWFALGKKHTKSLFLCIIVLNMLSLAFGIGSSLFIKNLSFESLSL